MISRAVTLAAYVLMSRREAGSDAISSTAGIATRFRRFTARGLAAIWVSMFADDRLRREGIERFATELRIGEPGDVH